MRFSKLSLATLSIGLLTVFASQVAFAQFKEVAKGIPDDANMVVMCNFEKLLSSPVAKQQGWKKNLENAYSSGITRLPGDTLRFVAASRVDFESFTPAWTASLVMTRKRHSLEDVAAARGGQLTTISEHQAILLPTNSYLIKFSDYVYGSMTPANRQTVARWIQKVKSGDSHFSPYIQKAVSYVRDGGTEVIMAIDLQDVPSPARVQAKLAKSGLAANAGLDSAKVVNLLVGIRGAMLGVTFDEKPYGSFRVDFAQDTALLTPIAQQVVLTVLSEKGVMIDEFKKWTCSVQDKHVALSGDLTDSGLRKVFSLIEEPATTYLSETTKSTAGASANDLDPKAVASQRYFKSVGTLLGDIKDRDSSLSIAQIGGWIAKYARKIDRLPMVNVDDEVLDYGQYVSQQLLNASAAIQGIGIRSRVREVNQANSGGGRGYYGDNYEGNSGGYYYGGNYYNGAWGARYGGVGIGVRNVQAGLQQDQRNRTQIRTQEKASGVSAALAIKRDIINATNQVRRKMTKKYNIQF